MPLQRPNGPAKKRSRLGPLAPIYKVLRNLTPRHWGWLHFKMALFYWATVMERWTPPAVSAALDQPYLSIWTTMTALGAVISIVGLVMSAQPATNRFHVAGVSVELAGLCMLIVGPLVYWTTQITLVALHADGLSLTGEAHLRYANICLGYCMIAAVAARILVVFPRFRRYSRRPNA